jgi:hypothetical protein
MFLFRSRLFRRLLAGGALAVITACLTLGPQALCRKAGEAFVRSWQAMADRMIRHDVDQLGSRLDDLHARLERARDRKAHLQQLLEEAETGRAAAARRLTADQAVLSQIADLLRSQAGATVLVDGQEYDREGVERDAEEYLRRCSDGAAEVARLQAVVAELTEGARRIDRFLVVAEDIQRTRQDEFSRLSAQAEAHRVCQDIAELLDDAEPTDLTGSWDRRVERTATLLAPTAPSPAPKTQPSVASLSQRLDAFLREHASASPSAQRQEKTSEGTSDR